MDGQIIGVCGLELSHEVAVVAFGHFDSTVAQPGLSFIDAIFHGDLAAGIGP